jgi:hypothetical protein
MGGWSVVLPILSSADELRYVSIPVPAGSFLHVPYKLAERCGTDRVITKRSQRFDVPLQCTSKVAHQAWKKNLLVEVPWSFAQIFRIVVQPVLFHNRKRRALYGLIGPLS